MSRYNNTNNASVLANLTHSMRTQAESTCLAEIKKHHLLCKTAAQRLSPADTAGLEQVLLSLTTPTTTTSDNSNDNDDNNNTTMVVTPTQVQEFLTQQRHGLRALAIDNIQDERTVQAFIHALQMLPQQEQQQPQQQQESEATADSSDEDKDNGSSCLHHSLDAYEIKIRQLMQQQLQPVTAAAATTTTTSNHSDNNNNEDNALLSLDVEQETWYREICTELGLPLAAQRQNNNDDDDDIQVMAPSSTTQLRSDLKCPLTAQLLEQPVRSKLCGHVYSKQAVENHIRQSNKHTTTTCPAAGCNNHQLSLSQLEPDMEKETLVRRYKNRQKLHEQQQASQAVPGLDGEDSDDDNDGEY